MVALRRVAGWGMPLRQQSSLWRAAARAYRESGRVEEAKRAARTAALIEGRPWKVDRG